jgi:hypothetical protein
VKERDLEKDLDLPNSRDWDMLESERPKLGSKGADREFRLDTVNLDAVVDNDLVLVNCSVIDPSAVAEKFCDRDWSPDVNHSDTVIQPEPYIPSDASIGSDKEKESDLEKAGVEGNGVGVGLI